MTAPPLGRFLLIPVLMAAAGDGAAQQASVPFDGDHWSLAGSAVVEHLGRPALRGGAVLEDVSFQDGVIEVDVAMDGRRCFPGIVFRMESATEAEYVYLRPHRSGEPVALQYTPLFSGLDAWQLYHGPGFTAAAEIPHGRWVHLRLEVKGEQARLFLDSAAEPALVVRGLKRAAAPGGLGLIGPPGGQVFFADFSHAAGAQVELGAPPVEAARPGMLTSWRLSRAFPASEVNRFVVASVPGLAGPGWREVESEPSGLVNVSRWVARSGQLPDVVLAATTIETERAETRRLAFGYSDEVTVFLNGRLLFWGDASFQSRDPMFYGTIGLNDAVFLPLQKGANELLFAVAESFGGWGFMARVTPVPDRPEVLGHGVVKLWETPPELAVPESVAFDPRRRVLYVSNFARVTPTGSAPAGFVSRLALDGRILDLHWIDGLQAPAGLAVHGDRLLVVERDGVAEIDLAAAAVVKRRPLAGAVFPNDIAVAGDGTVYVSDSGGSLIHRLGGDTQAVAAGGFEVRQPNGLLLQGGRLLFGNTGDQCIKSLDLASGRITSLLRLPAGIIDGLRSDGAGNLIVSLWHGSAFRVTPEGEIRPLIDSDHAVVQTADLEYVPDERLLVVPTFHANRVAAYRLAVPGTTESTEPAKS